MFLHNQASVPEKYSGCEVVHLNTKGQTSSNITWARYSSSRFVPKASVKLKEAPNASHKTELSWKLLSGGRKTLRECFCPDTVAQAAWQLLSDFNNLLTSISETGKMKIDRLSQKWPKLWQQFKVYNVTRISNTKRDHNPKSHEIKRLHISLNQKKLATRQEDPWGKVLWSQ